MQTPHQCSGFSSNDSYIIPDQTPGLCSGCAKDCGAAFVHTYILARSISVPDAGIPCYHLRLTLPDHASCNGGIYGSHRIISWRESHRGVCPKIPSCYVPLTIVSIVAVHGLNGHPTKTWTTEKTKKLWLQDSDLLPSHLKSARVLTFGYNAAVAALLGKTSSDRILQHAQTLVAELVADREVSPFAEPTRLR